MLARYLVRAVRSELAKLSWRNPLWYTVVPLAILIPVALNVGIAKASQAEAINGYGGMETSNATYWVLIFSTFILMSGAVSSLSNEFKDKTVETVAGIQARRWLLPVAKLLVYGVLSGAVAGATTFLLLGGFPHLFPDVWGDVDAFSGAGIRLLICVPIFTVLVCALGLGLAALLPKPGLVVMIVLLWKFGIEVFVTFVNNDVGRMLQRLSPFKNGELGVGQLSTIETYFGGPNGSLLYFAVPCLVVFVLGTLRLATGDMKSE